MAKIEAPATDVSLDQLVNAVFAAGGGLADISRAADTAAAALNPPKRRAKTARLAK